MQGNNPIRPPIAGDGSQLEVKRLFPTLQGEGPFSGQPAVFVRLGGCNLACSFCDTDFEQFAPMALESILAKVEELAGGEIRLRHLVVITGGEPLRQNIVPLCSQLLERGFQVQIETNGTLWRELPDDVNVVCSPKNTGQGYMALRDDILKRTNALKFIVSTRNSLYSDIGRVGQEKYATPVYVQPMDEQDPQVNAANVAYATQLAQQHGYRLSLQLHKYLGIE